MSTCDEIYGADTTVTGFQRRSNACWRMLKRLVRFGKINFNIPVARFLNGLLGARFTLSSRPRSMHICFVSATYVATSK